MLTQFPDELPNAEYPPYTFFTRYEWDADAGELLGWDAESPPVRVVPPPAPPPAAPAQGHPGGVPEADVAPPEVVASPLRSAEAQTAATATAPPLSVETEAPGAAAPPKKRAPNAQTARIASLEGDVERLTAEVAHLKQLFARVSFLESKYEHEAVFGNDEESLVSGLGNATKE